MILNGFGRFMDLIWDCPLMIYIIGAVSKLSTCRAFFNIHVKGLGLFNLGLGQGLGTIGG
jgi:hypothetical protein